MNRRLLLAVGGLAAVSILSSCSSVRPPAATVNGEDIISMRDFEDLATDYAGSPLASGSASTEGAVAGADARQLLTYLVQGAVLRQDLAANGAPLQQSAVDAQKAAFEQSDPESWKQLSTGMQNLFAERQAAILAFGDLVGTPADEIEANYAKGITESGVACVSHILVDTEEAANDALDRIRGGESFADVAAEVSTDGSASGGGALVDQNGAACTDAATFSASYVPPFVEAALAAKVGEPTEPVQSDFGYHIILVRPFDEVAEEATSIIRNSEISPAAEALFADVKVSVSPAIGTWSNATSAVEALDSGV